MSGFNVYPSEVEDVVAEVEGVAEVAVIGVDDPHTGEAVVAYVKPVRGDDAVPGPARRAGCASTAPHDWPGSSSPARSKVVDELPHTVTGKVAKGRLRATERRRALGLLE